MRHVPLEALVGSDMGALKSCAWVFILICVRKNTSSCSSERKIVIVQVAWGHGGPHGSGVGGTCVPRREG